MYAEFEAAQLAESRDELEPLRELFKDEVRRLDLELGLPREMVFRHPFPGPVLGVRILGEVSKQYADLLRKADRIFIDELHARGLYDQVSQAFAVFLPVRSVAVMGDGRRYDYVIALRAVETVDFMTARWARLPYEFLDLCARRISNEVAGISRVTYDISGKPRLHRSSSVGLPISSGAERIVSSSPIGVRVRLRSGS